MRDSTEINRDESPDGVGSQAEEEPSPGTAVRQLGGRLFLGTDGTGRFSHGSTLSEQPAPANDQINELLVLAGATARESARFAIMTRDGSGAAAL